MYRGEHRATKLVDALQHNSYHQRLDILGLKSSENKQTRDNLTEVCKIFTGKENVNPRQLFEFLGNLTSLETVKASMLTSESISSPKSGHLRVCICLQDTTISHTSITDTS